MEKETPVQQPTTEEKPCLVIMRCPIYLTQEEIDFYDNIEKQKPYKRKVLFIMIASIVSFFLVFAIVFSIFGSKSECGFSHKSTIKMYEYNATVINSTINYSVIKKGHRNIDYYDCITTVNIEPIFKCNIKTYTGSNFTHCVENQILNGSIINVYKKNHTAICYLNDSSRNCNKSRLYYELSWVGIVGMFFVIAFSCPASIIISHECY
jgi:hypothetical protein